MSNQEFSDAFDLLYNNITSERSAGLNEYEKSIFLTRAQNEIVRNYFESASAGNMVKKGFDDSPIRQSNFSNLITVAHFEEASEDIPKIDIRSKQYILPDEDKIFVLINEVMQLGGIKTLTTYKIWNKGWQDAEKNAIDKSRIIATYTKAQWEEAQDPKGEGMPAGNNGDVIAITEEVSISGSMRQIVPLTYEEYMRLMSKPFKEPLKWQAWRLSSNGTEEGNNTVEIILTSADRKKYTDFDYSIRYVRRPRPIILTDLTGVFGEGLTIEGQSEETTCELNKSVHDAILQRAVEMAKVAWEGDVNHTQMAITSGQRTE